MLAITWTFLQIHHEWKSAASISQLIRRYNTLWIFHVCLPSKKYLQVVTPAFTSVKTTSLSGPFYTPVTLVVQTTALTFAGMPRTSFSHWTPKELVLFLALYLATTGQVGSVSLTVSGTVFYYNSTLHDDNLVCVLTSPINSTWEIPTIDKSDQAKWPKLCVLITRGIPHAPGKASIVVAMSNHDVPVSNMIVNKKMTLFN